jgi:putative aldouronate transport system permease protein
MRLKKSELSKANIRTSYKLRKNLKMIKAHYQLYFFVIPTLLYFVIFKYIPMYGVQIAFRDFNPVLGISGIWKSPWVGFEYINQFINSFHFWSLISNTLRISLSMLIIAFPIPIIFALLLNEINNLKFKKVVQNITYAPHFISIVVMVGIIILFLSPRIGIINRLITLFGIEKMNFMAESSWFVPIYVISHIWQNTGYGSIIYLAVLSTVSPELIEAAIIDGASRLQKIRYVNFPALVPTIVLLFLLAIGGLMSVGFEKVLLLQNSANMMTSDVIQTYVYRAGLLGGEFSFGSAIGLFNNTIEFILLVAANQTAKKLGETSLF